LIEVIERKEKMDTVKEKKNIVKEKKSEKKEKDQRVRSKYRALAVAYKSRPENIGGVDNPLIAEKKQSKRALAVAFAIEADEYAGAKNMNEEAKTDLLVEVIATSGILYKKVTKYETELKGAESNANDYAKFGIKESKGENSYFKKYTDNVNACRAFCKAVIKSVMTKNN
jgi:hypothetical protein